MAEHREFDAVSVVDLRPYMQRELSVGEIRALQAAKAASVWVGKPVVCNGFDGTIAKVCDGQLLGMVEVRVPGGVTCVGIGDLGK